MLLLRKIQKRRKIDLEHIEIVKGLGLLPDPFFYDQEKTQSDIYLFLLRISDSIITTWH